MGGGLLQLVAIGPQNDFLINNPSITFFKKVYKRHTNFAIEQIEQTFIGNTSFGERLRCKIEHKGDLLKDIYIQIKLKNGSGNNIQDYYKNIIKCGFSLIDYVEIEIGGQVIDRHYGEWLDIWSQLSLNSDKYNHLTYLIKSRRHAFSHLNYRNSKNYTSQPTDPTENIYIPLYFWFNKDPGLALPLISLQFHEVILYLKLKNLDEIKIIKESQSTVYNDLYGELPVENVNNNTPFIESNVANQNPKWNIQNFTGSIDDISLLCTYIFLDTEERQEFTRKNHEYLIEQVQRSNKLGLEKLTSTVTEKNVEFSLEFNHPIKEIIWRVNSNNLENTQFFKNMDFTNIIKDVVLRANNIDFIKKRDSDFFSLIQPFQHHKCGGLIRKDKDNYFNGGIYLYSFSLSPENYQPSSNLNFSKLSNFNINFTYQKTSNTFTQLAEDYTFICYGINYNVLKIDNGAAGLVYSN